jgi:hypothetical protein
VRGKLRNSRDGNGVTFSLLFHSFACEANLYMRAINDYFDIILISF